MKFIDLCAGIGGISLGLERAGHECVGQVEIDDYCRRVLDKHWPHVTKRSDLKKVDGTEFGEFDLLAGGYPCQPFSYASHGSRRGSEDERHLWPDFHRIINNTRPKFVLLENVPGHVTLGLNDVLRDLSESGYDAEWNLIPASNLGAPQRRERLFIVAYLDGASESLGAEHDEARFLPPTSQPRRGAWPPYPEGGGVDDGIPGRLERSRVKALGNAVVPAVAQFIGEQLKP